MRASRFGWRGLVVVLAGATALVGTMVPAAQAGGTLDQQQTDGTTSSLSATVRSGVAQSFTAGATGALTQVDVLLGDRTAGYPLTGPLAIEIHDLVGGVPGPDVHASGTVAAAEVAGTRGVWIGVDFADPAAVQSGQSYAIVVRASSGLDIYGWLGAASQPYSGGAAFAQFYLGGPWHFQPLDLAFRTYVTPVAPAFSLSGFASPVDMSTPAAKVWNTVKGGRTVPLKFEVFDAVTGAEVTDTSVVASFTTTKVACDSGTAGEDAVEAVGTGATSLIYNTADGYFQQNWRTPTAAGTCYQVTVETTDGSVIDQAFFEIKR